MPEHLPSAALRDVSARERLIVASCIVGSTLILFGTSALRHTMFLSTAWDLAVFDQATYLISIGETPISSMMGYHILGDHASPIFYPLALLYRIYPTPYWLLLVQAMALALALWPLWHLARDAGLARSQRLSIVAAYMLYPAFYNGSLFDFHPDAIAPAAMLAAILAARRQQPLRFAGWIALALSSKALLALTVAAMGLWLWWFEGRRRYGAITAFVSLAWFFAVTFLIVPALTGGDAAHAMGDNRFAYLGATIPEILHTIGTRPWVLARHALSASALGYVVNLFIPVLIGLHPAHLAPLIAAIPQFALNLVSSWAMQRHFTNHYQLPIFPFLILAVLSAVAAGRTWAIRPRWLVLWSLIGFLSFARYPRLVDYARYTVSRQAAHQAMDLIAPEDGVMGDNCLLPHVAHRRSLYILADNALKDMSQVRDSVDFVFLNQTHPCSMSSEAVHESVRLLRSSGQFESIFERDGVILLRRVRVVSMQKTQTQQLAVADHAPERMHATGLVTTPGV